MDPLKKQFKILKNIAPGAEKKAEFRHALEQRVRADMRMHAAAASLSEPARKAGFLRHMFHAPSFALAIIIAILGSGGGAALASQSALPGTALYGIKRATERARVTLARDESKKAELHITFASRRLQEIERLISGGADDDAAIANTVAYYEHELEEGESLLAKDQSAAQTAAALIAAAETHKDALTNLKTKIAERKNARLKSRLEEAYEHAETHGDAALLAALSSAATSSDASALPPTIIETSRKKVRSLEKELAEKKRAMEAARKHGDDDASIAEAALKFESAETIVENAKSRLENEEYRESVERSIEARALMKEASSWEKKRKRDEKRDDDEKESPREHSDDGDEKSDDDKR